MDDRVAIDLKMFLDDKVKQYNRPDFIVNDPVCIPHRFSKKQDVEIMAFFSAILAWGQRKTIIKKCGELIERMDSAPYQFIMQHTENDLKALLGFKHRTFNETDLLYFVSFFREHYARYDSLEDAFLVSGCHFTMEQSLNYFRRYFFSIPDYPLRTRKHISSPSKNSSCKRLNMFLRWMVRRDDCGVDFGLWHKLKPAQLISPCDVHVDRVARRLGLINRKQTDWQTAIELTENLKILDPLDPVKYDFALFGLGVEGEM
ncbi:TIGR02757 family protein [bacterium A37T11]|nr:TIGR02757 family protein [bacterium A37T11]